MRDRPRFIQPEKVKEVRDRDSGGEGEGEGWGCW